METGKDLLVAWEKPLVKVIWWARRVLHLLLVKHLVYKRLASEVVNQTEGYFEHG